MFKLLLLEKKAPFNQEKFGQVKITDEFVVPLSQLIEGQNGRTWKECFSEMFNKDFSKFEKDTGKGFDSHPYPFSGFEIVNVYRIENSNRWTVYQTRCNTIRQESKEHLEIRNSLMTECQDDEVSDVLDLDKTLNEVLLFHGPNQNFIQTIAKTGVDDRFSTQGLTGAGIYLAENAVKSDQYTTKKDEKDYKYDKILSMFVCRAAIGNYLVSHNPFVEKISEKGKGKNTQRVAPTVERKLYPQIRFHSARISKNLREFDARQDPFAKIS